MEEPSRDDRFVELRDPRGFTLVRRDLNAVLVRAEAGPCDPFSRSRRVVGTIGGGRQPLDVVEIDGVGAPLVHKRLRRGGVLGGLMRGMASKRRARREVDVVERLLAARVPVVAILAIRATSNPLFPGVASIEMLSELVPDAIHLERFLAADPARDRGRRRSVLHRAGEVVAAMHRAGVFHVDLNLRNLIVAKSGDVSLLDFGNSRIGELSDGMRAANLARLWRSCVKRGLARRTEAMRFLRGYDRASTRAMWSSVSATYSRTAGFHRIAWRFSSGGDEVTAS